MALIETDLLVGTNLTIANPEAYQLAKTNKDAFILLRRNGFGASDSSILCGVNPYSNVAELIAQKTSATISPEERAIGDKVNVRKGADLEPLILDKFKAWTKIPDFDLFKPDAMYAIKDTPLTVNFDGVCTFNEMLPYVPVEAKFISTQGRRYWKFEKAVSNIYHGSPMIASGIDLPDRIKNTADAIGVPAYYYTQTQQQLLALDSDFGYLVALDDKDWQIYVFKIYRDKVVQKYLVDEAIKTWNIISVLKQKKQP